ncbi:DUF2157 domain-containing protein [Pseudodesulfovibrio tunisiensis]|uniref:DUF2157 domain-containing protein n=1 Tax=Pseudodesulfovibrio tunisiensis TaxID=463192 RepID=UPI001FB34526|nr:DUF2157 domain-containing protein [Pseudodesulfovibrio tunisiensis]
MKFTLHDLNRAVEQDILSPDQRDAFLRMVDDNRDPEAEFTPSHVLYYFGALVVMAALGWFVTDAWDKLGGSGLLAVALGYAALFLLIGKRLWKKGLEVPGGLLITAAVAMTPLAVYAAQRLLGWWPDSDPGAYRDFFHWAKSGWVGMEIATMAAGLLALRFFRFPFLTLPVAVAAWFLSMDAVGFVYGAGYDWDDRAVVSLWFGLVMIAASFGVDRRSRLDYAFWGYLFGALAFWGGLSVLDSNSEWSKFGYFVVNLVMMGSALLLRRRIFLILGGIGAFGYLAHLAYSVFEDSLLFPFTLSAVGLGVIWLGILCRRHAASLTARVESLIPGPLLRQLPAWRDSSRNLHD